MSEYSDLLLCAQSAHGSEWVNTKFSRKSATLLVAKLISYWREREGKVQEHERKWRQRAWICFGRDSLPPLFFSFCPLFQWSYSNFRETMVSWEGPEGISAMRNRKDTMQPRIATKYISHITNHNSVFTHRKQITNTVFLVKERRSRLSFSPTRPTWSVSRSFTWPWRDH